VQDKTLIEGCLRGDQGAWEALVNGYSKRVFNLAYQFSGSYQEAEDLTQDIFLKLHGVLPRYDPSKSFAAWLTTLAKNHLIDVYRKSKWEKGHRDDFEDVAVKAESRSDPEGDLVRRERQSMLWKALDELAPDIRMAVILRDIQGKSYEEMAGILDLPLGTVKSRINRGRLQLAMALKDRKGECDDL
jgi:RNA polymerase sigma-70 factor (ECF subfamily)